MKNILAVLAALIIITGLTGCSQESPSSIDNPSSSPAPADNYSLLSSPVSFSDDISELVYGNNLFAFNLYQKLKESESSNFFYSPYSISTGMAMVSAGARGATAQQMADTLHFTLPEERLNTAFYQLAAKLDQEGENNLKIPNVSSSKFFTLNIANALWGAKDYTFRDDYINILKVDYGGELKPIDFANSPESASQEINQWIRDQTQNRIQSLTQPDDFSIDTKLFLANTIYFKAVWKEGFEEKDTRESKFYLVDGSTIKVPMMYQKGAHIYPYFENNEYQAISLPYSGTNVSMVILLPQKGKFQEFEDSLNSQKFNTILEEIQDWNPERNIFDITLMAPKFKFESAYQLIAPLSELGIKDAFESNADFSGLAENGGLQIDQICHKTFISVDEKGTEAAASTGIAVVTGIEDYKPISFIADHPFIFLIRDNKTGTILFIGRVMNPQFQE